MLVLAVGNDVGFVACDDYAKADYDDDDVDAFYC